MRTACWTTWAANSHSEYVTHCFSTATAVMRTHLNVKLRVHCVSCGSESNVSNIAIDSRILYIRVEISQDSRWVIHHEGLEGISLITWILHLVLCYATSPEVTWSKCYKSLRLAWHCDTLGWVHTCNFTASRCSGRNRIIPLMRQPNTDSTSNKPVTLPRNKLLIRYVGTSFVHTITIRCYDTR
jgi:hypothetical protein